jgi:hypothetical protein
MPLKTPVPSSAADNHALDITLVPAIIQQNIVRLRAVKLFHEVCHSVSTSVEMEQAIYSTFTALPIYSECIARFFTYFKSKDNQAEVRDIIQDGLQPHRVKAFLTQTFQYFNQLP